LESFVDEPHAAIEGPGQGEIVNLTDHWADESRRIQLELLTSLGPDGIARELSILNARETHVPTPSRPAQPHLPHLDLPGHHDVRVSNVDARRLYGNLAAAADRGPTDFTDLLLTPGVGARTVRALAMVAEIVHGAPYCFADPARFSFAHGGKDRHPFPVPIRVYDETIRVLKSAVSNARLGRDRGTGGAEAARCAGPATRTSRFGSTRRGADRGRTSALALIRWQISLWMGPRESRYRVMDLRTSRG
jgi:hypothetical protein